jgi:hypothetical protein
MTISTPETIPIVRIFSMEKPKEFYVSFLGFSGRAGTRGSPLND